MTTIKDIAKAAGVSPASVSRVINNGPKVGLATREKIQRIIREMGYSPNANAQAINALPSKSVGIVLANLEDPFYAAMAHGIEKVAAKKGAQILLNSSEYSEQSERRAIETLLEHRYKSIVVHSLFLSDDELVQFADAIPGMVLINRYIDRIAERCVWLDDEMGGRLMAQYLVQKGHQEIAIICADGGFSHSAQRLPGAISELKRLGIDTTTLQIEMADATYEGGQTAIQDLVAAGRTFSALIAYNDPMAIGAIAMLSDLGYSVPGDVSIIGYDNLILASCIEPKLTTIHHPIEDMAVVATEMALLTNSASLPLSKRRFFPSLIERQSVAEKK